MSGRSTPDQTQGSSSKQVIMPVAAPRATRSAASFPFTSAGRKLVETTDDQSEKEEEEVVTSEDESGAAAHVIYVKESEAVPKKLLPGEDSITWLHEFKRIRKINEWTDRHALRMVCRFTHPGVADWIEAHPTLVTTFHDFMTNYCQAIQTPYYKDQAFEEMSAYQMKEYETIASFNKVMSIFFMRTQVKDPATKLRFYLKGLSDDYYNYVAYKGPHTLAEAKTFALKFESKRYTRRNTAQVGYQTDIPSCGKTAPELKPKSC
ncbi:hypothetical protein BGZ76_006777 [Entomortierella beljakovae]|nr:hypothetical protein BGZ76_006777 [Entomortierella beljakovae]